MHAATQWSRPSFSGDTLVIDKSMNTVTSAGGIYVINYDGELFVKRVQKQLKGTVAITSDNKNYGDIVIASADLNTLNDHRPRYLVWSSNDLGVVYMEGNSYKKGWRLMGIV